MSEQKDKKPIEAIKEKVQEVARVESAPAPVRRYRAVLFQTMLFLVAGAFAVLTFLVKVTPSFAMDLQITKAMQTISLPSFALLMTVVSWVGFPPQAIIITALIVLLIYGFGLHWESVMALVAAVFSTAINILVKDLIQRPRPGVGVVNVIVTLNSYSFPSGHVMFYLGFFGFVEFLVFSLLKPSLKRDFLLVCISVLIILVGPSRIYLGEHWASDVLGAFSFTNR